MTNKLTIRINDYKSTTTVWLRRLVATAALVVLPIMLGVLFDSAAMQWMGFIFTLVAGLSWCVTQDEKTKFTTYAAAIGYLQELQAAEKGEPK